MPLRVHARYGLQQLYYFFNRYVLWRSVDPPAVPHDEALMRLHSRRSVPQKTERDPTARV